MSDTKTGQNSALEVTAGIHAGVTISLQPNDYTIGSTPDANIVLLDEGVQPLHASLRIGKGGARVQAVGGDVRLDDGQLLPKGFGAKLRLPATLSFGDASLRISRPGNGKDAPALGSVADALIDHPMLIAAGTIGAVLLISAAAGGLPMSQLLVSEPLKMPGRHAAESDPALAPKAKPASVAAADAGVAAEQFSRHLKNAGLGALKVTAGDRRVAVSGALTAREAEAWAIAQRWFDDAYAGRIVLTATVAVGESRTLPTTLRLQSIWYGERPYVITEEGLRFFPGAYLNNGWIIQEIAENRVVLTKDGETMTLTYR